MTATDRVPAEPVTGVRWAMVPIVVLRQAGFPVEVLDPLVTPEAVAEIGALLDGQRAARELAGVAKRALRGADPSIRQPAGSRIGLLQPLPDELIADAPEELADPLRRYQGAVTALAERWTAYREEHARRVDRARLAVVSAFADGSLREVLLLSNDANYGEFARWLDKPHQTVDAHARRMTDLLAMYLQRVATKNETHSHFGPITVGRVDRAARGVTWTGGGAPERRVFASHWAVTKLAEAMSTWPGTAELVRPRRRPLAFLRDGRIDLYAFTSDGGLSVDWSFQHVGGTEVDADVRWLWERCDGTRTVAALAAEWSSGNRRDCFAEAMNSLVEHGFVVCGLEVPVGVHHPLRALRDQLGGSTGPAADAIRSAIDEYERLLSGFEQAPAEDRAARLAELKSWFEEVTGCSANRFGGLHSADRAVMFEEAHSGLRELRAGRDIADFVTGELAMVYETVLAGPRLRMARETVILRQWFERRFGRGGRVPLDRYYAAFFADRRELAEQCASVDAELSALDERITEALLAGHDPASHAVTVPVERVTAALEGCPAQPHALCNPDVLFIAPDQEALAADGFTAVIGDCHCVRDVLTHTSFSSLVQDHAPDLLAETGAAYRTLLDDDEVLVDLRRGHPDKISAQLPYPGLDLEVFGRSPKPRHQVVQPAQLYLELRGERLELRASGVTGRLRLLAPPFGGPSIWQDPLSPFAFPRHFGGVGVRGEHLPHVPRIQVGRVVLQRETWRVPVARLRGWSVNGNPGSGDAAEFVAGHLLRTELAMPRHVFVTVPGEPKPVYLDWEAPLLVRQVFRLARRASGTVTFAEMLPGPDDRWLRVGAQRFTAELRCTVYSPRPDR